MFDLRRKPQNGLYVFERAVTIPDQYPDRFDQLVSAAGVIETRWNHTGALGAKKYKSNNGCFSLCAVFLKSGSRAFQKCRGLTLLLPHRAKSDNCFAP